MRWISMKHRLTAMLLAAITLIALALPAGAAQTLEVDSVHSSVVFEIVHNDVAPFFGRFNGKSGSIELDMDNPAASSISFEIDPSTVDTGNEKRDAHVMSPDFFSATEFPVMSFESSSVSLNDDGSWSVTGMLELRGVSREITLDVMHRMNDGGEQAVHGFYTEFTINRKDFNIGESFADSSLSEQVTMYVSLEAK